VGPTCHAPRAVPGPRGSAPLPRGCHVPRALRRCRDSTPHIPTARLAPARPRAPPSVPPPLPTAPASLVPPTSRPPRACHRRPDRSPRSRRSPIAITPRRRLRVGEPPFPFVSHAPVPCRAVGSLSSATAEPCPAWMSHRAALCIWAERGFGPVTPG
jgi:hypothetical protein